MRKIWSTTKGLTWTMHEFDAAKARWQARYHTPGHAEAAISALNQCRLTLADIFLMG